MSRVIFLRRGNSPVCLPTFLLLEDCIHEKGDTGKRMVSRETHHEGSQVMERRASQAGLFPPGLYSTKGLPVIPTLRVRVGPDSWTLSPLPKKMVLRAFQQAKPQHGPQRDAPKTGRSNLTMHHLPSPLRKKGFSGKQGNPF